jgi:hypothetical protein
MNILPHALSPVRAQNRVKRGGKRGHADDGEDGEDAPARKVVVEETPAAFVQRIGWAAKPAPGAPTTAAPAVKAFDYAAAQKADKPAPAETKQNPMYSNMYRPEGTARRARTRAVHNAIGSSARRSAWQARRNAEGGGCARQEQPLVLDRPTERGRRRQASCSGRRQEMKRVCIGPHGGGHV